MVGEIASGERRREERWEGDEARRWRGEMGLIGDQLVPVYIVRFGAVARGHPVPQLEDFATEIWLDLANIYVQYNSLFLFSEMLSGERSSGVGSQRTPRATSLQIKQTDMVVL
jgi:hypothetical protein